jgi:hypothetical protein
MSAVEYLSWLLLASIFANLSLVTFVVVYRALYRRTLRERIQIEAKFNYLAEKVRKLDEYALSSLKERSTDDTPSQNRL